MSSLIAIAAGLLLAGAGVATAATLGIRESAQLLLAAYVIAFAVVVGLSLLLSPLGEVRRPWLLAGVASAFVAAAAVWWRHGRPRPAPPRLGALLASAPLAVLALVVLLGLGYSVALAVRIAPNSWDSLVYHLARAAFWRQGGTIGYISDPYDDRLNSNPPNAEIALTFVLELTRDERFAGLVQLTAAIACALGVFVLARRVGLAAHEAGFGALLFLTLPIVVLQTSTTQNDLVVAALLVAATVFLLGESRSELVLTGLATALAMGTKVTAVFALPLLGLLVLVTPRPARHERLAAIGLGALAGSYWYVVNLVESGSLLGERPDTELLAVGELRENVLGAFARILDAFDLSGAEATDRFIVPELGDADVLLYVITAAVLAAGLLASRLLARRPRTFVALAAGACALAPLAIAPLGYLLWRVFAKTHDLLSGVGEALPAGEWPPQTTASESLSWFGPLGLFLASGAAVACIVLYRRGAVPGWALLLAAAPLAWLVLLSLSIGYDVWQGRFFVYPVALSAALWGLLLRAAPVAWATVAIGATTIALVFVNSLERPSGIQLFADRQTHSIWGMERWEAQSLPRPETAAILRFLEEAVPSDASIALLLGENEWGYPAFGPHFERQVELVGSTDSTDADWLVSGALRAAAVDVGCWRRAVSTTAGWSVSRRVAGCRAADETG